LPRRDVLDTDSGSAPGAGHEPPCSTGWTSGTARPPTLIERLTASPRAPGGAVRARHGAHGCYRRRRARGYRGPGRRRIPGALGPKVRGPAAGRSTGRRRGYVAEAQWPPHSPAAPPV